MKSPQSIDYACDSDPFERFLQNSIDLNSIELGWISEQKADDWIAENQFHSDFQMTMIGVKKYSSLSENQSGNLLFFG